MGEFPPADPLEGVAVSLRVPGAAVCDGWVRRATSAQERGEVRHGREEVEESSRHE